MKETLASLKSRVHWFAIPILASILGWLLISQYETKSLVVTALTKMDNKQEFDQKLWTMVVDNNRMLIEKADQKQNELDHGRIMVKLDGMRTDLDKMLNKGKKYGNNSTSDINNPLTPYFEMVYNSALLLYKQDSITRNINANN